VTSNINSAAINENFPVAGQDNDTQVFRDNFDTIKTSLLTANTEITALQAATEGLALDAYDEVEAGVHGSDFNNRIIYSAVLQNSFERKFDGGNITAPLTIDYQNGNYQVYRIGANITVDFLNFPDGLGTSKNGKVTLELYGDGGVSTDAGQFVTGSVYTITTVGSTNFTLVGASSNTIGITFTATGTGSGNGKAQLHRTLTFSTSGGTVIKKNATFPATFTLTSAESSSGAGNPVIIEVWQNKSDRIFLNYVGQFSS
jgi:hypothetical protein